MQQAARAAEWVQTSPARTIAMLEQLRRVVRHSWIRPGRGELHLERLPLARLGPARRRRDRFHVEAQAAASAQADDVSGEDLRRKTRASLL
jgi:hypothetical protein